MEEEGRPFHSKWDIGTSGNIRQIFGANKWLYPFPAFWATGKPIGDGIYWQTLQNTNVRLYGTEDKNLAVFQTAMTRKQEISRQMHMMSKQQKQNGSNSPCKISMTNSNARSWGDSGRVHSSVDSSEAGASGVNGAHVRKTKSNKPKDPRNRGAGEEGYLHQARLKGSKSN